MSRIDAIFNDHRAAGRTALMPFLTAGYPSMDVTAEAIPALEEAGASIVELGVPFSDPIADGPVIAESMHQALLRGVTPAHVFEAVRSVRSRTSMGLIAMVSHSIVDRMGAERFIEDATEAGIDGLIVPDIDLDAARDVKILADDRDLSFSLLVAPTTNEQRLAQIVDLCTGFVYVLARVGITGERDAAPQVAQRVQTLRNITDLPLAVGFGISKAEHVKAVTESADAAIVGSALVRRMGEAKDPVAAARQFVSELAAGLASRT
ncbi:MAG: tryptophan synthase subunit alpha [Planctomycetota bacterium]|nr:tryptophan synthase subunit alpha [Planctomycetota bacterium]